MTYAEKLNDPRWQKKRLSIFQRDEFKCLLCTDDQTQLHVHHDKYVGKNPWDTPDELLKTYCKHCHAIVEDLKKEKMSDFRIEKCIKYFTQSIDPSPILIAVILKFPSEDKYSYLFYHWHLEDNSLKYNMCITPYVLKDLYAENLILREKSNKSNG